jgi:hypothetical protein
MTKKKRASAVPPTTSPTMSTAPAEKPRRSSPLDLLVPRATSKKRGRASISAGTGRAKAKVK